MKIVIAGGSGFVGSHLVPYLRKKGHTLVTLTRSKELADSHFWSPENKELDLALLEGADVVINLAGESIIGRWNQKKMEKIRESRLEATRFLCESITKLKKGPQLYFGASAIGFYGDRGEETLDEQSAPGTGFLPEVCQAWESIPQQVLGANVRVVLGRFGLILGPDGGALQFMEKAFKTGMGGVLGSGKQYMSWIAIEDVCAAVLHVIDHLEVSGPVNFVAPEPVTNADFTQILGKVLGKPTVVSVPKMALTLLFGQGAELFLASSRVVPKQLTDTGFVFQFSRLEEALKNYLRINV